MMTIVVNDYSHEDITYTAQDASGTSQACQPAVKHRRSKPSSVSIETLECLQSSAPSVVKRIG